MAEDAALVEQTVAGIQRLAGDYFFVGDESGVHQFQLRAAEVWIAPGTHFLVAAVIRGDPPTELRPELEAVVARIEHEAAAVADFRADAAALEAAGRELTACLRSAHKPMPQAPKLRWDWITTAAAMALGPWLRRLRFPAAAAIILFIALALLDFLNELRWRDFVTRLKSEPGILVASAERNRFAPSRVQGLRDPLARDPAAIASDAKLNPARIRFEWKDYSADDAVIAERRTHGDIAHGPGVTSKLEAAASPTPDQASPLEAFKATFKPPPTVDVTVADNTLVLAGAAPYEWVAAVREGATRIRGISAIKGDDLVVEFDQDLVLQRFREEFGVPDGVDATLRRGRLILSGDAPHSWLDRVRREALRVPGIRALDYRKVENIDQRALQQAKSALEEAAILFVLNRDTLLPETEVELGRLAADARQAFAAAANMGVNISLEVRAYGDAIATDAENAELSKRRAEAVRKFLAGDGIDEQKIVPAGMGTPPPPGPGERSGAGKFDRRVFFRVAIQP